MSGGSIGNIATSFSGDASISGSPVTQNAADIQSALRELMNAIEDSDIDVIAKNDAKVDVGQLALELERPNKNAGRIKEWLGSVGTALATSPAVIEALSKLTDTLHSLGWI